MHVWFAFERVRWWRTKENCAFYQGIYVQSSVPIYHLKGKLALEYKDDSSTEKKCVKWTKNYFYLSKRAKNTKRNVNGRRHIIAFISTFNSFCFINMYAWVPSSSYAVCEPLIAHGRPPCICKLYWGETRHRPVLARQPRNPPPSITLYGHAHIVFPPRRRENVEKKRTNWTYVYDTTACCSPVDTFAPSPSAKARRK